MRQVSTAILPDPEARAGDDLGAFPNPSFGHMREPVLYIANILRGLNATLGGNSRIFDYASKLGQDLFRAPSVFSYFSPQYRIQNGLLGPEFQIYSTHTAIGRVNFVDSVLHGSSTRIDLVPFVQSANDVDMLLDAINRVFLHQSMSPDLRRAAYRAASAADGMARVRAALYVVLTSAEYQIIQ